TGLRFTGYVLILESMDSMEQVLDLLAMCSLQNLVSLSLLWSRYFLKIHLLGLDELYLKDTFWKYIC
ncbi:MAG: hypothetical protein LBI70_01755, partial [Rickettsiales bacterium]|nr:hypothetical protein [Rickettsiales bacterium]